MSPIHDLKTAFSSVTDTDRVLVDPAADLARARRARSHRRRHRLSLGAAGLAVVAVIAVGAASVVHDPQPPPVAGQSPEEAVPVTLVAERLDAAPYTFDLTPAGWSVQAQRPTAVTIAPDDGSTSKDPDDFGGKLVILFDNHAPSGQVVDHDGRRFWLTGDSGYVILATRTRGGEPAGVVRIQYPKNTGWDQDSMLAFLGSVHVGSGALPGHG